jgi:hypothetical protein
MLMFGVVPPLDASGLDAVTLLTPPPLPVELIVWFGQVPVIVTLVPATRLGVVVPVPPFAIETGVERANAWFGKEPETESPVPALRAGDAVPVPPLAIETGVLRATIWLGNVPETEIPVPALIAAEVAPVPPYVIASGVVRAITGVVVPVATVIGAVPVTEVTVPPPDVALIVCVGHVPVIEMPVPAMSPAGSVCPRSVIS